MLLLVSSLDPGVSDSACPLEEVAVCVDDAQKTRAV